MATLIFFPETSQFRQAITDAHHYACPSPDGHDKQLPVLNFIGTVKLHGANTAIGYRKSSGYWCQSRNRVITPDNDHADFAQHIYPFADEFFSAHVLPHCPTIREHYQYGDRIVIYGEWCGGDIQQNIAICGLPTMFVIFKVKIVNQSAKTKAKTDTNNQETQNKGSRTYWLNPKEWTNIKWHERSIYNIFDFPTYTIEIDFNNPELSQDTLTKITEQVEQQCPVGTHFNRIGIGEGVVWTEWTNTGGNLTFKVKGREHLVTEAKALVSIRVIKLANVDEFIAYACTENRMRQALDYMREQDVPIDMKTLDIFLRWLGEDICKEERDTMNASNVSAKEVIRVMAKKAETWFMEKVTENRKRCSKQRRTGNK
ncbi:unnamed protein product [Rotaria sp. Silwood2]|nr:unnamed protein product [Rotaria sp. Silwood2]CAF3288412.1 unnamed protein product [Rotaria sp. Silwood2]CAF4036271.1 unnamed protein product [Rotaria sp. Silwood2]CAF4051416.1 unnamed protein product [Rotaria sp. Silwood2]CAF4191316.1 unnamed protein product [Rotaria sp. Silwood2]